MNFFCTTLRSFVPLCIMFPRSLDSTGATPTFNVQMALALMRRQLPAEQQRLCEWCVGLALTTALATPCHPSLQPIQEFENNHVYLHLE